MNSTATHTAVTLSLRVELFTARVQFYVRHGVGYAMARQRAHVDIAAMVGE